MAPDEMLTTGSPACRRSSSSSHLVTTYVRQQPLFDERDDVSVPQSLGRFGMMPKRSRVRAAFKLLSSWEGRDALLQLAQSITLLAYSLAPVRRKQLHIASEGVANARRILVLGRWTAEGGEALREMWLAKGADSEKGSSDSDESDQEEQGDEVQGSEKASDAMHRSALQTWQKAWERRVGIMAEYLTMAGEGCEVAALLGGSSVLWRVLGGKLAARQRRGLERVALFILFFAFSLALRHVELLRRRRLSKLRTANKRLLLASDQLTAEADASTLLSAERLSPEQALTLHRPGARPASLPGTMTEKATLVEKGGQLERVDTALRKAEAAVFFLRQKMQLLRLERTSIRAELVFVVAEIFWPRHDHTRLEGWTSLIAAFCHMSRLTKEARWQQH